MPTNDGETLQQRYARELQSESTQDPQGVDMQNFQPMAVQDQLDEHQGTEFEIYEFSNGIELIGRIMTRHEFGVQYGRDLRIQLERARENRRLNRVEGSYRAESAHPGGDEGDPPELIECDFCGATVVDPWHTSDATRKHLHQCDACHAAAVNPLIGNPVAWMQGDEVRLEHGCHTDERALERGWIPLYAGACGKGEHQ